MNSAWQAFYIGMFVALGLEAGRSLWKLLAWTGRRIRGAGHTIRLNQMQEEFRIESFKDRR